MRVCTHAVEPINFGVSLTFLYFVVMHVFSVEMLELCWIAVAICSMTFSLTDLSPVVMSFLIEQKNGIYGLLTENTSQPPNVLIKLANEAIT